MTLSSDADVEPANRYVRLLRHLDAKPLLSPPPRFPRASAWTPRSSRGRGDGYLKRQICKPERRLGRQISTPIRLAWYIASPVDAIDGRSRPSAGGISATHTHSPLHRDVDSRLRNWLRDHVEHSHGSLRARSRAIARCGSELSCPSRGWGLPE